MHNTYLKYALLFLILVIFQGFVINYININAYIKPMIYPIFVLLLPYEVSFLVMTVICLALGMSLDVISDTFGLHTSSLLLIGFVRPRILDYLKPRDGYDNNLLPTLHDMGMMWFLLYATIMLSIHHLWFFIIEIFRFDLIGLILGKVFFSLIFTLVLVLLFQYIFFKPSRK